MGSTPTALSPTRTPAYTGPQTTPLGEGVSSTRPVQESPVPPSTPSTGGLLQKGDTFTRTSSRKGPELLGGSKSPEGSTLETEDIRDGRENCLDQVGDFLAMLPPALRGRSDVLFLKDTRPGAEGATGHTVIRQGDNLYDPATRQWTEASSWMRAHPEYQLAATVPGQTVHSILSTEPGPARQAALEKAQLPEGLSEMLVADGPRSKKSAPKQVVIPMRVKVDKSMLDPKRFLIEMVRKYSRQYSGEDPGTDEQILARWKWDGPTPKVTADDVGKDITVTVVDTAMKPMSLKEEKATDAYLRGLSPGDRKKIDDEARKRFKDRTGGTPGSSPTDKAYLKAIQGEIVQGEQLEKLQALPQHVRDVLFQGDRALQPEDFEKALRVGQKLSKLSAFELEDYLSKVTRDTSDWGDFESSVDRYLADRQDRLQNLDKLQSYSKRLDGLGEIYKEYKAYRTLKASTPATSTVGREPNTDARTLHAQKVKDVEQNLTTELQRHGFSGIPEFEQALKDYRTAFEKETLAVAKDLLDRTDHVLFEEEKKYQDPALAAALYPRLSAARTQDAKALEEEQVDSNLRMGSEFPGRDVPQIVDQRRKAQEQASSFRAGTRQEADKLAREFPLLRDAKLDLRKVVQAGPEKLQSVILEHIRQRRADIQATRSNLASEPNLIYGLDVLMKTSRQVQGIQPGSVQDLVIQDHASELKFQKFLVDAGLSALGLAAGLLTGGTGTLALLAAAGIGATQVVREVQDYQQMKQASGAGLLSQDPSMAGVVLAIVGAGLDIAAAGPVFDAVKAFRKGGDAVQLEKELRAFFGTDEALVQRVLNAAKRGGMEEELLSPEVIDAGKQARNLWSLSSEDLVTDEAFQEGMLKLLREGGGDPRVSKLLQSLDESTFRQAFREPEALIQAASSRDSRTVNEVLEALKDAKTNPTVGRDALRARLRKAAGLTPEPLKAGRVDDPAELARLFREKFGSDEVVVYRGVRVPKGTAIQGTYKSAQNGGQMVSTLGADSIASYALKPAGKVPGGVNKANEMVFIEFRIRPEHILYDPYGTMHHLVLKPDVDITKLPGYRELRVPYKPQQ